MGGSGVLMWGDHIIVLSCGLHVGLSGAQVLH